MIQRLDGPDWADSWTKSSSLSLRERSAGTIPWREERPITTSAPTGNDARVALLAERALSQKDFRFSRCVSCESRDGTLILSGRVPTYYLKQLAQAAVSGIEGVEQIDNRLDVFVESQSGRYHA
ncbi:MAG: BON domain-containing protein [Pirellulales bacterium]|nr:BON domain-containing protein [Pirellulales bacterium]